MRDIHISKIKGIGICLMVLGHALWLGPLRDIIYLFHMPLFFITTGYLFKETWLVPPPHYMLKINFVNSIGCMLNGAYFSFCCIMYLCI